jgi:hypothetical protein
MDRILTELEKAKKVTKFSRILESIVKFDLCHWNFELCTLCRKTRWNHDDDESFETQCRNTKL